MTGKILLLAALLSSTTVFAASGNIRSDRDDECAIYLCLPQGFITSYCAPARKAMIKRITDLTHKGGRKYTDLPFFHYCIDDMSPELKQQFDDVMQQTGVDLDQLMPGLDPHAAPPKTEHKIIDYRIVTPEHKLCTKWKKEYIKVNNNMLVTKEKCAADTVVKEKEFIVKKPNYYPYEISWVGMYKDDIKHENSLIFQRSGIFVENEQVGNLHEEQIWHWY